VKVAIIGGGCAGLAAAWELSKQPNFQVSVYEKSWRLGGKGASGRDDRGRIIEHGLHMWLGFYENAFKMIRECYEEVRKQEWGPGQSQPKNRLAHATFDDAFLAEPNIGVVGNQADGQTVWTAFFPPEKGIPGDPIDVQSNPFTIASYLLRCVDLLKALVQSVVAPAVDRVPGKARPDDRSALDETIDQAFGFDPTRSPEVLIDSITGGLRDGSLTLAAAMLQALTILENILHDFDQSAPAVGSALNVVKALLAQARKQLGDFVTLDENLRWKTEIVDIVMTIMVGLYRDRLLFDRRGFDAINDYDYRDWLRKHGATESAVASRFITGIYDLVFAYEGGDRLKPRLAAGVALRGALRMFFTYRGAMFWRMRSGMGDAVFAPLYKVMGLEHREDPQTGKQLLPVRFNFLHTLEEIRVELAPGGQPFVTRLAFGAVPVSPSVDDPARGALDIFGCWPNDNRRLIPSGDPPVPTPVTLTVEKDFDVVVFAGAVQDLGRLLRNQPVPPNWRPPDDQRQTVATMAMQIWVTESLEQLGWYAGPSVISALQPSAGGDLSFGTWADMTQTLPTERAWRAAAKRRSPEDDEAKSVAYFCGVFSDSHLDATAAEVLDSIPQILSKQLPVLWPSAFDQDGNATYRPISTMARVNATSSDRYSLSLPGTLGQRLSPLDRGVLNMTVAGDWTACGLDVGCVEAAVMSGKLAAFAITGDQPSLESIIGYDHP